MRQTDMDGGRPLPAARPRGRPAFIELPLRLEATAADGAGCRVVVQQDEIIVERPLAGLTCAVRLPAAALEGVAAAFLPGGPAVRLVHREAALTIDLIHAAAPGIAIELRDCLARALRLPALFVDADGEVFGASRRLGRIAAHPPQPRRGGRMALKRRPRFLTRRAVGDEPGAAPIAGREIIARS
jgi:hypothetical protein